MLGAELRKWREGMAWSQDQAATALGRTRRAYQEMENSTGHIDPNVSSHASVLDYASKILRQSGNILNLPPDLRTLFGGAMDTIAQVNNMSKPGRPKRDVRIAALEDLYDAARQHRGIFLNRAQGMTDHLFQRALVDMINLADVVALTKGGEGQ